MLIKIYAIFFLYNINLIIENLSEVDKNNNFGNNFQLGKYSKNLIEKNYDLKCFENSEQFLEEKIRNLKKK